MKSAYFLGNQKFELREEPLPTPGKGELLVKNAVCGVCGTDIHIYHGEPGSANVTPPVVLGHEYAGTVHALGAGVTGFSPGDKVTIDPNIYCGVCRFCRAGKKQLCENMRAIGVTQNGGFAEYSTLPAAQAFLLHPNLDFETGAMAEPLACCLHGIDLANIRPASSVLVIGGGAIGLLMIQLAKLSGAAHVLLSEPVAMRRETALQLGADACFDPLTQNAAQQVKLHTGHEGADVVIECVGNTSATQQAFECAAKGATLLLFSVPNIGATFPLPLSDVFKKELTIKGSFVNPDTHARAVSLLNTGRIQVKPLITHTFALSSLEQAIATQMGSESIKVMVRAEE